MEQGLDQRCRIGVDLVGEVAQRGATWASDRLATALRQPDTADTRRLHVLHVLLALLPLRLAPLLRGTTRLAEGACSPTAATAAPRATARSTTGTAADAVPVSAAGAGTRSAAWGATASTATAPVATTATAAAATGATPATAGATTATAGPPTRFGRTRRHHAGVGLGRHVSRTRPASGFGLAFRRRALATGLLLPAPLFALLATGTLRALPLSRRTGTDTEGIVPHTRTPRARLRAGFRTLGLGWHDTRTALAGVSIRTLLLTFGFALRRIRS